MGWVSLSCVAGALLVTACGGSEFIDKFDDPSGAGGDVSGAGGAGGSIATGTGGHSGTGSSGSSATGSGGGLGNKDASTEHAGSAGQPITDASPLHDGAMREGSVDSGSVDANRVDASALDASRADSTIVDVTAIIDVSATDSASTDATVADVVGAADVSADVVNDVANVDAADAYVVTQCPASEPSTDVPCTTGLKCTYGQHPRLACRRQYTCTSSHWVVAPTLFCPDLPACTSEDAGLPVVNTACPVQDHDCIWDSGLYCRCLPCAGGGAECLKWDCYPPPSSPIGCAHTPTNLGQPCGPDTATCAYGSCGLGTKVTTTCENGTTQWQVATCP